MTGRSRIGTRDPRTRTAGDDDRRLRAKADAEPASTVLVVAPREVTIASAGYDARALRELAARLRERIVPRLQGGAGETEPDASRLGDRSLLDDASRLVVVLHDRLWGRTAETSEAAAIIRRRLDVDGPSFLRIVLLDDESPDPELAGAETRRLEEEGLDGIVDWLVAAVHDEGGKTREAAAGARGARAADAHKRATTRAAYLGSPRALPVCARELERLAAEVSARATAAANRLGATAEIRRVPGRCIVQLGPVALTISWVRDGGNAVSDGVLLVGEWEGTVARGAAHVPERSQEARVGRTARMLREMVLVADATSEEDWRWRDAAADVAGHASHELAARCVDSLVAGWHEHNR